MSERGERTIYQGNSITVNGKTVQVSEACRLVQLLSEMGIDALHTKGVAVAVNEAVVLRKEWAEIELHEGDRVEVVTAKQGG